MEREAEMEAAMSTIGSGAGGVSPIINSVAGTAGQQRVGAKNQQQAIANERQFAMDQAAQHAEKVGDVGASSESSDDRDADGRLPWQLTQRRPGEHPAGETAPHARDPDGEVGGRVDFDA